MENIYKTNNKNKIITINFFLAGNIPGPFERIVIGWTNVLVKKNINIIISFPFFDYFDYYSWNASRLADNISNKWLRVVKYKLLLFKCFLISRESYIKLVVDLINFGLSKYSWNGKSIGFIDRNVKYNSFFLKPSNQNMPTADYIVVLNGGYPVPNLLQLEEDKGEVIASIHMNYISTMSDPSQKVRDWYAYDLSIIKRLNIKIFAESVRNKKVAEELQVSIVNLVPPGVNLAQFTDSKRRGNNKSISIMLFYNHKPQKGPEFGCAIINKIRKEFSDNTNIDIIYSSIGILPSEYANNFDTCFGYLTGSEYLTALKTADIFIWPEQHSGFATPPLQAMASGCALVTTIIDGTEEYCVHGVNSMTSSPDDINGMVNNVRTLILNVGLRDKIKDNALQTVKRYSWEASANKLLQVLEC